jgi:hypothetical protein
MNMLPSIRTSIAVVLAVSLFSSPAFAQPKRPKSVAETLSGEARKQFDAGVALAQRGQWDGARASWRAAYEASKNPRVLFNVAISERQLGRYAAAIDMFNRELTEGKGTLTPEEETEVRGIIAGLEKLVASLAIDVSEPGADVYVDGDRVGQSPLPGPIRLQLGRRNVRASKSGFSDTIETVELQGGGTGKITLKMVPYVKTNLVTVTVIGAPNAIVKIDGREVGPAPYKGQVTVSAEPHQFTAEAPGFNPVSQPLVVKEGGPQALSLAPSEEQKKGRLVVTAQPEGALIEIDGQVRGATKWNGALDVGIHQVVVKKQGFYTASYDVEVQKDRERPISASLNEDRNTSFVPWLIGTVVVIGLSSAAVYFVTRPKDEEPVKGTLPPFALGTSGITF